VGAVFTRQRFTIGVDLLLSELFIVRGLAHDPQGVLTAVCQRALVGVKLCLNTIALELNVAPFAYADSRGALLYDPQFALLHDCSLAHRIERV